MAHRCYNTGSHAGCETRYERMIRRHDKSVWLANRSLSNTVICLDQQCPLATRGHTMQSCKVVRTYLQGADDDKGLEANCQKELA